MKKRWIHAFAKGFSANVFIYEGLLKGFIPYQERIDQELITLIQSFKSLKYSPKLVYSVTKVAQSAGGGL